MADNKKYVLDTNIFIEAKRRYYAFDLCPGFWESLLHHNSLNSLESIDKVAKELSEGRDLDEWMKLSPGFFVVADAGPVTSAYGEVIQWAHNQDRFTPAAKSKFADDPDAWVIAYAKAIDAIVVTHEVSAPNSRKEVKIPDVCDHFGIEHLNTFDMLRRLKVEFNWEN